MNPWLLALVYALAFIDRALVAAAGGAIKADLGLSDMQFGLLGGTAFVLLFCLASLPLGWLADRMRRRALTAAGILFWSAMTALCGLSHDFSTFALARVGVGLGEACLIPAGISLLRSGVAPDRRARAVAIFLMGATGGNALALLGGGQLLLLGVPWRTLFLGAALLGAPLAAAMLAGKEPPRPAAGTSLAEALRPLAAHRRAYALLTAATACTIALSQSQAIWIPQFFARRFALAPGQAAMLTGGAFILSAPLGQWLGGSAIDRLRTNGAVAPAHLVLAACCAASLPAAALLCGLQSMAPAIAAYFLFNAVVFAATPAGLTGWQALTPPESQGLVIALLTSAATLAGVGLGPPVVGLLADRWTLAPALLGLVVAAGVAGLLLALAGRASFAEANRRLVDSPD